MYGYHTKKQKKVQIKQKNGIIHQRKKMQIIKLEYPKTKKTNVSKLCRFFDIKRGKYMRLSTNSGNLFHKSNSNPLILGVLCLANGISKEKLIEMIEDEKLYQVQEKLKDNK